MLKDMHNVLTVFCLICKEKREQITSAFAPYGSFSGTHFSELFSGEKKKLNIFFHKSFKGFSTC